MCVLVPPLIPAVVLILIVLILVRMKAVPVTNQMIKL